MKNKSFAFILFLLYNCCLLRGANDTIPKSDRLIMSDAELEQKKCEIITEYFEFKKYIDVLCDDSEIPRIKNSNEIALYRLLSPKFLGGRDKFITNVKENKSNFSFLKNAYEVFDCPNFDFMKKDSPLPTTIQSEMENMNIVNPGHTILTKRYSGYLLFKLRTIDQYNINQTIASSSTIGLEENIKIMRMHYYMYKLDSINYVLKIENVIENGNSAIPRKKKTIDGDVFINVWVKPDADKFEPCCDQPDPPDTDSDGFNDLVDCDILNPNIYPGAPEIIGDGIDQDCDGVDQLGEDKDGDGYYYSACNSPNLEDRKKCDCYENDPNVYYREPNIPESEWHSATNGWNDDNCDCIKDKIVESPWVGLKVSDYIIPGKGHLKRGPNSNLERNGVAFTYFSTIVTFSGFAIYSKIKSQGYRSTYLNANTFRKANRNLNLYRKHNRNFLISAGLSSIIFATNLAHLKIKDNKQKKLKRESFESENLRPLDSDFCLDATLKLNNYNGGLGISLAFNLN